MSAAVCCTAMVLQLGVLVLGIVSICCQILPNITSFLSHPAVYQALMDDRLQSSPITTATSTTSAYSGIMLVAVLGTVIAALYLVYKHTR